MEEPPQPHEILELPKSLRDELLKKAIGLCENGYSLKQIGLHIQTTKSHVRNALIKERIRMRPSATSPQGKLLRRKRKLPGNPSHGYIWVQSELVVYPKETDTPRD